MEPWYKVVVPRKEVREGRSFNPDEFAIALEQVVAGTAPLDYRDPAQFFERTSFTRALSEHTAMVLQRLAGRTENTAPVLTLVTQFGGGKTHTLTTLYHLVTNADAAPTYRGIGRLLEAAELSTVPKARVAVFVGNAWDPSEGLETPWIDVARQLAGDAGVAALGSASIDTPPGTDAIARVFEAANAPVLLLFDEVLNYLNRHRKMADSFHAFIQNLTVATTGTTHGACVISLPRSQVEMTDWDQQWQERITKVVRRVAKDLIANDEAEISEVVRNRLFQSLGSEKTHRSVARAYADWCFERRAQLPPEWTAVDSAATESKAREFLQRRFEACYPFHPATLSVFQRKWQALPQYQQTRGTLAMLAQWVSLAAQDGYKMARTEPLITLGSALLDAPGFRSAILGQLGEPRLEAAIATDLAGDQAHARALDADTKGPLRDIHRRVGTTILFESSGGQTDKVAHLPELRFALGEPDIDTTSIDSAALALEDRSYFIRRVGSDGFRIGYQPTLKKVVSDRRASLDEDTEIKPFVRNLVEEQFRKGAAIPVVVFPTDGAAIPDSPRLTLVVFDPEFEWPGSGPLRTSIVDWTRRRGESDRLYPAALIWCLKKPGSELRDKVELSLAWARVAAEVNRGELGTDFDKDDRANLQAKVKDAEGSARDEVWGDYRFAIVLEASETDGLKVIDLGAGHSSSGETLSGRVIAALKAEGLLSESVGAGYIERSWPPALKESGAWPLASLRQGFLDGSLTRLVDPDSVLKKKIVEFVASGDFGLGSGTSSAGGYDRVWFKESVGSEEVDFASKVFLLKRSVAESLVSEAGQPPVVDVQPQPHPERDEDGEPESTDDPGRAMEMRTLRLVGTVPSETWNRLGIKILPKLRQGSDLTLGLDFTVSVRADTSKSLESELRQAIQELDLDDRIRVEESAGD